MSTQKPFVKVGHRFGSIFLRVVSKRITQLVRLDGEQADAIADELRYCASRVRGDSKSKRLRIAK